MPTALKLLNLSKQYRIGAASNNGSLRESVTEAFKKPFRKAQAPVDSVENTIWALKDVSFSINRGEVVGIVGRNGAGKSTLLKILSQITAPTSGEAQVFGSLTSLLEVGTGFHPELTGRENIFLNGSILGMDRVHISERFDDIVSFADIGRFLDTPVKHYSSGMYVRLAFAVAAHLNSDILLMDEVLAVGDVPFQKKCLAKMGDVGDAGRTVLFVSHSMTAVRQLCSRCILIERGQVIADGETAHVLQNFSRSLRTKKLDANTHSKERFNSMSGAVRFTSFRVEDSRGNERYDFKRGDTLRIHVTYQVYEEAPDLVLFFAFTSDTSGEMLTSVKYTLSTTIKKPGETGSAVIELPDINLRPREYHPYVWLGNTLGTPYDRINYYLTSCAPVIISPDVLVPDNTAEGYFNIPSRLISQ